MFSWIIFTLKWVYVEKSLIAVCAACLCQPVPNNNVIMSELKQKNVKILTEKVLLLLNRGGKRNYFWEHPHFYPS